MTEQEYKEWYIKEHRWDYIRWRFWRLYFTKKLHTKEAYIDEHYYNYVSWKLDKLIVNVSKQVKTTFQAMMDAMNDSIRQALSKNNK